MSLLVIFLRCRLPFVPPAIQRDPFQASALQVPLLNTVVGTAVQLIPSEEYPIWFGPLAPRSHVDPFQASALHVPKRCVEPVNPPARPVAPDQPTPLYEYETL